MTMTNNDLISRSEFRRSLIIWAEKLHIAGACGGCEVELMQAVIRRLDAQAAVDAEPVRHGKWILNPCNLYNDATWVCSACGHEWTLIDGTPQENGMHYCPKCGAKMDGGIRHESDHQNSL